MKHRYLVVLMVLLLACFGNAAFALTYYSRTNGGNWSVASTWSTDAVLQCTGAAAAGVPGAADDVFICAGFTVIFDAGPVTVSNLTVRGTLTITANKNLTCNSLALYGILNGAGTKDVQIGNATGSTLSGTGSCSMTGANLKALNNMTIPNTTDYITFNGTVSGKGSFDIANVTITNNGRVDILDPMDFIVAGTSGFVNNGSSSYLKYTKQANFPNGLVASAIGNTVEFGSTAGGPWTIGNASSYYNLIISGAAAKRLFVSPTNIGGNLSINNGATFDVNNNNINIAGDWINNLGGSFTEGTRTVTFNGTANNQTIFPPAIAAGETFYNLTINNTFSGGTVTAAGNVTITSGQVLTLTSGIFDVGTNTLGETAAGARYTATGGELRLAKLTTLPELTGAYTLTGGTTTFNGAGAQTIRGGVTYYNVNVNSSGGSGTKTLGGAATISGNLTVSTGTFDVSASNFGITLDGNWSNAGSFVARSGTVTLNGSGTQTITNATSETFNSLTVNATGPITLGASTDVMVTNTLTMTSGDINLNGRTLTLGNGAVATLVRTSGTMYSGTFRRFLAAGTAISSTAAPLYGLFPMGISTAYRPIELNSTANPTSSGYVSATHTDGANKLDLTPTYSDAGTTMTRIHLMQSALTTSGGFAGGTYNINVTFTNLVNAGATTDERLLIYTGGTTASSVGTHVATGGSVSSPIGKRTGLTAIDLSNIFVIGSSDAITTPLGPDYFYSRVTGNWDTSSTWSTDAVLQCAGAAATTTPRATDNVIICSSTTVTYDVTSTTTIKDLTVQSTGVLNMNANQLLNCSSIALSGVISGSSNKNVQMGNTTGSTLSGTGGTFIMNNANLTLLNNVTIPNGTDFITFNNSGKLDINGKTLTNNGRLEILDPSDFLGIGSFVNNASTSYLKYTKLGSVPNNIITATATGNTVEYGATAAGPFTIGNTTNYYHLVISGAAAKRCVVTTSIAGNLTIGNLSTFDSNGNDIILSGNWINNLGGSFTEGVRKVTFNGSANNQTIFTPAGGETFGDLTINNTFAGGTVTASGTINITAARTLTMTSGIFDLGTNTLGETGASNFTATGGDLRLAKTGVTLPEITGTYNITGGTITFNGAGNQTIRSLNAVPSAYFNIVLANAGNKTLVGSIQVQGDYSNNGSTLVPGTNTVTFIGTGTQTITAAAGESFYNLTTNTTGPLALAATTDVTITNQLTLTSALINLNGRTLTLGSSGVASTLSRTGSATTNWMYGGTFKRFWLTATAISSTVAPLYGLFPMGASAGSNYRPVEINSTVNPTGGGFFTTNHVNATNIITLSPAYNDAGTNIAAIDKSQFITAISGVTGGTYNINVTMTSLADGTLSDIRLAVFTGGTTASAVGTHAASTGTPQNPTAKRTGITTLTNLNNDFRIATTNIGATPLPIELTRFVAEFKGGVVALQWETESEMNSDFFVVQKTNDGEKFVEVTKVKAAGISTTHRSYAAIDEVAIPGKWYYRLKQSDYDGTLTYSKLIAVRVPEGLVRHVYPNPSDGTSFHVNFLQVDLGKQAVILLHDINGQETVHVVIDNLTDTSVRIDTQQKLAPGIYVVSMNVEQEIVRQKLIVR